jgi:hypothetical protein
MLRNIYKVVSFITLILNGAFSPYFIINGMFLAAIISFIGFCAAGVLLYSVFYNEWYESHIG